MLAAIEVLTLPRVLHHEIVRHATASVPREAVGLVGGDAVGRAKTVMPLTNVAPDNRSFLADPYDQFVALRDIQSQQLTLLAIYHSHPRGGIVLSDLDAEYARQWDCAHLVITVGGSGMSDGGCRAFRILPSGTLASIPVHITP